MEVYCFDFDGVVCDSAPETALAAWNACGALWPAENTPLPAALQERFCRMRPVLHTGFEAVPLMRLIADGDADDAAILSDFDALRDRFIQQEQLTEDRLKQVFAEARDALIEQDRGEWLRVNRFYPGIGESLSTAIDRHETFVITTKQERFVELLLNHNNIKLPMVRVFALEQNKTKPEILAELMARPALSGGSFHFIEDRMNTLNHVIRSSGLAIDRHETFVITTKQERFVELLLNHNNIKLPMVRVFALEQNKTKPEILAELMARPALSGGSFHFIEDRMNTLNHVIRSSGLEPVKLYLVDWGYNTPAQREEAAGSDRIRVISMDDLRGMLGL